jgi:HD-GYP domain-containing protein (c-di-GMP phosphodiesterase class II)
MLEWKLNYPGFWLDRRLTIPAGTTFSEAELRSFVSWGSADGQKKYPLMEVGTVRKDLLHFLGEYPCNSVFSNGEEIAKIFELMGRVQLARPKLDSVEYFKAYDPYTYRHILTVFAYSTLLSIDLVEDHEAMIGEEATSPLHDFGKICVPLEILKKASPLTRDERNHLEHHTLAGYILLSCYAQDAEHISARIARDHHERRTGSGYPRGIRLEDPMVEIVAVCDIYDALTSQRPYRSQPYDNRSALEEITLMAERKEVNWAVVQALVARNRKGKPHFSDCSVSTDKRGIAPPDNLYGIITP